MVHGGLAQRGMKTVSSRSNLLLPGVIRDRRAPGANEPDRECGRDARMQLCTAQRIVASAARWRAREGKSNLSQGVHCSRQRSVMKLLYRRCAGMDVHKKSVSVCIRRRIAGGGFEVEEDIFGTFTQDPERLRVSGTRRRSLRPSPSRTHCPKTASPSGANWVRSRAQTAARPTQSPEATYAGRQLPKVLAVGNPRLHSPAQTPSKIPADF